MSFATKEAIEFRKAQKALVAAMDEYVKAGGQFMNKDDVVEDEDSLYGLMVGGITQLGAMKELIGSSDRRLNALIAKHGYASDV